MRGSVLSIKEWPIADRPRERLLRLGAGALSTVELLTIIVGCGNRAFPADEIDRRLTVAYPGLRQLAAIARIGQEAQLRLRGVGEGANAGHDAVLAAKLQPEAGSKLGGGEGRQAHAAVAVRAGRRN